MANLYPQSSSRLSGLSLIGLALSFGLLSSGDRSVWSAGAGNTGVDPLEILNLAVRPNAIFVLDSSGSMGETLTGSGLGADHPDAKMAIAKTVINTVVAANQTKVSFQFGRYTQPATTLRTALQYDRDTGTARFEYVAANPTFTNEPAVHLRLFEVPAGSNWTVGFRNGNTSYTTAPIPAGVYTGTELASQIAALMNAQHAASYTGTFSDPATATSPAFTFTRASGNVPFAMRFDLMDPTLRGLLRAVSTESNDVTSPYSIQPHVGTFTTVFNVIGSPTIRFGHGGLNCTGTLTDGSYSAAQLADHVASRMNALDSSPGCFGTPTVPPNSFVVTGTPTISIRRGGTTYTTTVPNGTYTGSALATLISDRMDAADPNTNTAQINYTGTYSTTTGIFTFTRSGSNNNSFGIDWTAWSATLRDLIAAPASNTPDASCSPCSHSTNSTLTLPPRVYAGTVDGTTGVFTFTRTGWGTTSFDIDWSAWTPSLRTLMGTPTVDRTDSTSPYSLSTDGVALSGAGGSGPSNSTAPLALYRRTDSTSYDFTSGGKNYYRLFANKFFNGHTLSVLPDGTPCALTTGTATSSPQVTIQRKAACSDVTPTDTVVFLSAGSNSWLGAPKSGTCGGFESLVSLAPCTANEQLTGIATHLQREIAAPGGVIPGYVESASGAVTSQPTPTGIRAAGFTPIAESLIDVRTVFNGTIWPSVVTQDKKQTTFVIFLTDGDDTCDDAAGADLGYTADQNALRAAHKAEQLYKRIVAAEPASSVTTFVVSLGSGAAANRTNWVAWGGSGMSITPDNADNSLASTKWSAIPTAAQRTACTTCRDAFLATDAASLSAALQSAIDLGQSAGEFSDQQSITETVYEYVSLAPQPTPIASPSPTAQPSPFHPLNPLTRYGSTIPVLLQSTFEMPLYTGHLKAFRNNAGTSELLWDAGAKLKTRVTDDTGAMGTGTTYDFVTLYGNARTTPIRSSSARIKRRIYTTSRQGVLSGYTAQNLLQANLSALAGTVTGDPTRVEIWPPPNTVAPTGTVTGTTSDLGSLDAAFGLIAATTVAQVQALIPVACLPSADPTPVQHPSCTSGTAGVPLAQARREAREVILAFIAGAQVSMFEAKPRRASTGGALLFEARPWIMAESTLAAPAVVTPPLVAPTTTYKQAEYLLFRDGPRDANNKALNATAGGLGLRNPDLESPQTSTSRDDLTLKPQMSVIYHATNFGLHAFRAGPCPTSTLSGGLFGPGSLNCSGETGGEEMWAFVPFDQLGKLVSATKTQSRVNKTYILAAPVRVTDVFVSGSASTTVGGNTVSVTGVWRTLAIFGRGAGGKSMTVLDVTVPGPFVRHSLETTAPILVWSRGNYDTSDGMVKTGSNSYVNSAADYTAYLGMGETWSVPAVGFVTGSLNTTARHPVEFALFMGSGYSDNTAEGKTFFVLDALSGDVVRSFPIANGTTATTVVETGLPLQNSLPASPLIYAVDDSGKSPAGLDFVTNPVEAKAKYVYFGDLHSRIWRYAPATPLTAPVAIANLSGDGDQPFSNGLSLLEVGKVPNIWFSSGRDSRVPLRSAAPRFRMYGYSDATLSTPVGPVAQTFARDFPANYRGNSAPAAAFTGGDTDSNPATPPVYTPIVFYTALSYVSSGATPATVCQSRFDSVLFALQGLTGVAAFDLNSTSTAESDDAFVTVVGQILQNPHITSEGTIVVDRGLGAQTPPPPPAAPELQELPPQSQTVNYVVPGLTPNTKAWNILRSTTSPYRTGTSVCNTTY